MKRTIVLLALPFWLAACAENADRAGAERESSGTAVAAEKAQTEAERANAIFEAYFQKQLELNPIYASAIGDDRYNDRFAITISPEWRAEALAVDRDFLAQIQNVDESRLEGQDLLSYQVFVRDLNSSIESTQFPSHLLPLNQFYSTPNFFAQLGSGQSLHPFKTVKNYEDFLKRVDGFVGWVDQAIVNMDEGIEKGYVQPKILIERVVPQLQAHIVGDAEKSLFWGPIRNFPEDFSEEDKANLTDAYRDAITNRIVPAYEKLHAYVNDTYLSAARETHGMAALPNGEEWYAFLVKETTTTDLTPAEIHQIGLDEVKRIHDEMRGVMRDTGFEGTLHEFFEFMNEDPRFIAKTQEELLAGYRAMKDRIAPRLPELFDVMPEADYEVRPVEPFREKSASSASYMRGTPDGSRPGIFYLNTYDLSARPKWATESLSLHEAAPGHHFQLSIQQELEELPSFRRFGGYTAFTEGWGLYAETLGKELGVYTDPYQYFGKLNAELWRAVRLVVDTGLHYKGWTREQVLDFMYENSAVREARAVSEAERYMAIPSQALAYKIGQLKISSLRAKAEKALGEQFDIREFHNQVLLDGALPLDVLENKIDRWIKSELAR